MGYELPEITKLADQLREVLIGRTIRRIDLSEQCSNLIEQGMCNLGERRSDAINTPIRLVLPKGKWIFISLDNGFILLFGEMIGKLLYHRSVNDLPKKYHLLIELDNGSFITFQSSLYAFMLLLTLEEVSKHPYVGSLGVSPLDSKFTYDYFCSMLVKHYSKPLKGLLNQQSDLAGIGNAYINEICFEAKLHPRRRTGCISEIEANDLYESTVRVIRQAMQHGGSAHEIDIYGQPGEYINRMDKDTYEKPCPVCGKTIEKENVLGSTAYYCPSCQKFGL